MLLLPAMGDAACGLAPAAADMAAMLLAGRSCCGASSEGFDGVVLGAPLLGLWGVGTAAVARDMQAALIKSSCLSF